MCASPQYVDQQWDVNPRPSARELLDKDVKNQDSYDNKLDQGARQKLLSGFCLLRGGGTPPVR